MSTYEGQVGRRTWESATLTVEAGSEDEAQDQIERQRDDPAFIGSLTWGPGDLERPEVSYVEPAEA
jgi:hypothetical protein